MAIQPCPSCEKDDQIRKISSILSEQNTETSGVASTHSAYRKKYDTFINMRQKSELAGRIAPERPVKKSTGAIPIGCGTTILIFMVGGTLMNWSIGENHRNTPEGLVIPIAIGLALVSYGIWAKVSQGAKNTAIHLEATNFYERAKDAWFCSRCDIRFDSGGAF